MAEERPKRQMSAYPKVPELCERLRAFALQHQPHDRLPGIAQLCKLLGTSSGTLNEVLGLLEAQDVLYRKVGRGIYVSPQLFRTRIGILFSSEWLSKKGTSPFWGSLLENFRLVAQQRYHDLQEDHLLYLLPHELSEPEGISLPREFMQQVEAKRIQGALGVTMGHPEDSWLRERGVTFVTFASYSQYAVGLDESALIRLALLRLIEQGCSRIGLWGPGPYDEADNDPGSTFIYFRRSLHELGQPFDMALVQQTPAWARSFSMAQQGSAIAQHVFGNTDMPRPDGLVLLLDSMTEGIIVTLQMLGVRLGEQLKIATHGNKGLFLLLDLIPELTVIEYDPQDIVRAMFNVYDQVRAGRNVPIVTLVQPHYRQRTSQNGNNPISISYQQ